MSWWPSSKDIKTVNDELAKQGLDQKGPFADAQRARIEKATKALTAYGASLDKEPVRRRQRKCGHWRTA